MSSLNRKEKAGNGFLTVLEVAEIMNVSKAWVYRKANANKIPHVRVGSVIRFPHEKLMEWLKTHERGNVNI